MFRATELKGVGRGSSNLQFMVAFQQAAECTVERFIETPNGWLLLASIPGKPNTGGIYLYDDRSKVIFWLSIAGRDDDFSAADFDKLVQGRAIQAPSVQSRQNSAMVGNAGAGNAGPDKPAFVSHRRRHHGRRNRNDNRHSQNGQGMVHTAVLQQAKSDIAYIPTIAVN